MTKNQLGLDFCANQTRATAVVGLTCFLVPRWRDDGRRNAIYLMWLKDKVCDRA
jgi:hypothetical protein